MRWVGVLLLCGCTSSPTVRVYPVEYGTSLSVVSAETGPTVEQLKTLNHLDSDLIVSGTGLLVPDGPRTARLPEYVPHRPAPQWRPCRSVAFELPELPDGGQGLPLEFALQQATVDLDGTPPDELVVSAREAVSMGIAIEVWSHTIFSKGRPVAHFETNDFGHAFIEQDQGCAILDVHSEGRRDQLRGWGVYFGATPFQLRGGRLVATGPEVLRRNTHRFEDLRFRTLAQQPADIVSWFTDDAAVRWGPAVEIGRCVTTIVTGFDGGLTLRDQPERIDAVLDGRTKARFPANYDFGGRLEGREVQLCTSDAGVTDYSPWFTVVVNER